MSLLLFPIFYLKEILVGAALVARDALITTKYVNPTTVELNTATLTLGQRYTLACLISMTPGTLAIGEYSDGLIMQVHCLYGNNPQQRIQELESNYRDTIAKLPI